VFSPVLSSSTARRARAGRRFSWLFGAACALLSTALARPAEAQISSWVSAEAGPSFIDEGEGMESQASLLLKGGVGTSPERSFVLGGLFHSQTHFGRGTDLGLLLRVATQGYTLGRFGLALDLGGYERFWGRGSEGGLGALVLGAPWGLTLSLGGGIGTNDARHASIVLGFDFARLTAFRLSGESWFPNPHPAYRPAE
jgi:hypothetical protein